MIAIRRARFDAALIASVTYNAHRSADADPLEPWDFLPGYERDPEDVEHEKHMKAVRQSIKLDMTATFGQSPERVAAKRQQLIDRMRADGIDNPEAVYAECFPE